MRSRRAAPLRIAIFVGAIMLPTILLGYLATRTAEIEKLLVWEKLKESYTSLAKLVSEQLDNIVYSAENDLRDSLLRLPSYSSTDLAQLSQQLEARHEVIGQVFFLNPSGQMVYPEDPRMKRREAATAEQRAIPDERDADIFATYMAKAERQEFRYNDPQRAIDEYQRVLDEVKQPDYRAIALNSIARCYAKLGSDRKAVDYCNEVIDGYIDAVDNGVDIGTIAYLQASSILSRIGDVDTSAGTFMEFYEHLASIKWDLDAEEIWYFADKARKRLLTYRNSRDARFAILADRFAEVDTKVIRMVREQQFLGDYTRLVSQEMTKASGQTAGELASAKRLLKSTDTGPYLISYIPIKIPVSGNKPEAAGPPPPGDSSIAVAGFEVDLFFLASRGFRNALSHLTTREDAILAILNEDGKILGISPRMPMPGVDMEYDAPPGVGRDSQSDPPGQPITTVISSSLPFWQVGVYLKEPGSLEKLSKRKANLRILAIVGLILAIAFGIYLIVREERREAELAQLRSDFVANVSHELRTPLSSIQILSETLKRGTATGPDRQGQYLDTIASESDRLARLVGNVLDFSKLERSVEEFNFQPINIGEIVTSAVEAYRFFAEQRDATIALNVAQELPDIEADSEAISQLVINLVDNAVKYSDEKKEITVNVFRKGDNIVIQIADRGIGIDEKDLRKIFDKFYRGKNASELGTGGTGLGLTLARGIAMAHGGDIRVRSKKGMGSRFSVILPLRRLET